MVKKEVDNSSEGSKDSAASPKEDPEFKRLALESIIKRIDYYSNKNSVTDVDLYYLIKDFFREFLRLKYEFSLDELILELDKIYLDAEQREKTFKFINKVKIIEYHDSSFSEIKIRGFILEFSAITKLLMKNTEYEHKSFWNKIKLSFKKKQKEEDLDYHKDDKPIRQAEFPVPAPLEPGKDSKGKSLDSVTETEFSSSNETLKDEPSEELSKYKLNDETKKKKDKKQFKTTQKKSENESKNSAKNEEFPVHRKSYAQTNDKEEDKTAKNESWDSDLNSIRNSIAKEKKNTWTEPPAGNTITEDDGKKNKPKFAVKKSEKQKIKGKEEKKDSFSKQKKTKEKTKPKKDKPSQKSSKQKKSGQKKAEATKSTKKNPPANKKTDRSEQKNKKSIPKKTELEQLIDRAKKLTNKSELMELYKKINAKYESSDIELQAKCYKNVMDIYKRLSKLK